MDRSFEVISNTVMSTNFLSPRDLTGISYLTQQSFLNQMGDVCI